MARDVAVRPVDRNADASGIWRAFLPDCPVPAPRRHSGQSVAVDRNKGLDDEPRLRLFGPLSAQQRLTLLERLRQAEDIFLRLSDNAPLRVLREPGDQGRINVWENDDSELSGLDVAWSMCGPMMRADGTSARSCFDLSVTIEPEYEDPGTWDVWTSVGHNCDRYPCLEDPHDLLTANGLARTPAEAVELFIDQIEALAVWLAAQDPESLRYFKHGAPETG
jgi:hypothetical protein